MLVGRSAETATIDRLIAGAREGSSGVLVIRGLPGIGKSALIEYAAGRSEGMTVLRAVGIESESELAFAALHQLLRPALGRLDELPDPQAGALRSAFALSDETVDDRFRVAVAVLGLLAELAEEQPVLCLVDDAQWLDRASAEALLFAARRLQAESLAMVFAARDDRDRPFEAHGVPDLRPGALSAADARALLEQRLGDRASADAVEWVLENAAGNPLALIELPAALTSGQLAGAEAVGAALPPATSVEQAFLARVNLLAPATRKTLLLAAAEDAGDRATITAAATMLGLDLGALAAAEQDGLVRVTPTQIEFAHPLIRAAVYRGAGFAEREQAHRALADALTADADGDRRAWHLASAAVGADESVAARLEQTAERARLRGGYDAAAAALARAAELSADRDAAGRRLVRAALAAELAGRGHHAVALAGRAESIVTDPLLRADIAAVRGNVELAVGRPDTAADILSAGSEAVAPHDPIQAMELAGLALEAASASGDDVRLARVIEVGAGIEPTDDRERALRAQFDGWALLLRGDLAAGVPDLRKVADSAELLDRPRDIAYAAGAATMVGEDERARALYARAVSKARAAAAAGALVNILAQAAWQSFLARRLAEAASHAGEAVRLATDLGIENPALRPRAILAWLAAFQGREDDCRREARAVLEVANARGLAQPASMATWAVAELDFGRGRWEEAFAGLQRAAERRPGFGSRVLGVWSAPDRLEAAVRCGRLEEAAEAQASFQAWMESARPPWGWPLVERGRALLAATPDEAAAHYEEALALNGAAGSDYNRARTQLLYGELLRRERQRIAARDHLRSALATFEELGAALWAERAGAELRATGEKARRRDPSTIAQLTPQEEQIARLVAEGGSNKEIAAQLFLSPRTVEYHLRKVFTKLGITSRTELIRLDTLGAGVEPAPSGATA